MRRDGEGDVGVGDPLEVDDDVISNLRVRDATLSVESLLPPVDEMRTGRNSSLGSGGRGGGGKLGRLETDSLADGDGLTERVGRGLTGGRTLGIVSSFCCQYLNGSWSVLS